MTKESLQYDTAAVQELSELLNLAEESTANIDHLTLLLEKLKTRFFIYIVGAYGLLVFSAYSIIRDVATNTPTFYLMKFSGVVGVFGALALFYGCTEAVKRIKSIRRDEKAERDIQERLISLIDDQSRRVRSEGLISTISATTFDIRLRRLDRSDSSGRKN